MEPRPEYCLLCSVPIVQGIDIHVKGTHNIRYQEYCELFSQCDGIYCVETDTQRIITMTRIIISYREFF